MTFHFWISLTTWLHDSRNSSVNWNLLSQHILNFRSYLPIFAFGKFMDISCQFQCSVFDACIHYLIYTFLGRIFTKQPSTVKHLFSEYNKLQNIMCHSSNPKSTLGNFRKFIFSLIQWATVKIAYHNHCCHAQVSL